MSNSDQSPAAVLGKMLLLYFRYRPDRSIHRFLTYQVEGNRISYSTDKMLRTCMPKDFFAEMAEWTPVDEADVPAIYRVEPVSNYTPMPPMPAGMSETFAYMLATLKEATDKVKASAHYLPQARGINNLAKTTVAAGRLQLDAMRALDKKNNA